MRAKGFARAVSVLLAVSAAVALAPPAGASAAEPPGAWRWPLDGAGPASVVRAFDPPVTRYAAGHRGVDLARHPGAPVRAAGAGRVSFAGRIAGRGVIVVVHGELRTTYEPVTAAVGVGTPVGAGDVIGTLAAGHLGCPAEACLHWGLKRGEDYLDPLRLLSGGPVRLLPLGRARVVTSASPAAAPVAVTGDRGSPADEPPLRRTAATSGGAGTTAGAAALAVVLLLALGLLRGLRGPRPRPGGSAAALTGAAPVRDELAARRGVRDDVRRRVGRDLAA